MLKILKNKKQYQQQISKNELYYAKQLARKM